MIASSDARNLAPPWSNVRFWAYVGAVGLGAVAVVAVVGHDLLHLPTLAASFWVIVGLLIALELRPLFTAGSFDTNGLPTSQMFVFALLLHWGLAVAILGQALALVVEHALNHKSLWRLTFNIAQYTLSFAAAQVVLLLFGRAADPLHPSFIDGAALPAFALAALAFFVVNTVLVGLVVAFLGHSSCREAIFADFGMQVIYSAAMIALSVLVVLAAARSVWLVPLLLVPLFALYRNGAVSLVQQRNALHDGLTGLPNRKLVIERTQDAVRSATSAGHNAALLMLDINRFKEVNDTLGHHVGDSLLQLVAARLATAVRPDDTVGRLGGDEFAVLLPQITDQAGAEVVADRITRSLAEPFAMEGMSLEVGASIGICVAPECGADCETLMQRADVAMYVAKEGGLAYQTYSPAIDRNSTERLSLLTELRHALDGTPGGGELQLHYQPQVDLVTGEVDGVEALIRWLHPQRGLVPPDEFIPLVEQTSMMRQLTRWVVDTALAQMAAWADVGLHLRVAVNISVRDLHSSDFAAFLAGRLGHYGLLAGQLQLELTESMLMSDSGRVGGTLSALDDLGLQMSLDDFGTGYSSLAHLRRLPVNEIKVDRSFVLGMLIDEDDRTVVRTIIELGAALGLRVVAEGVETLEMATELRRLGCGEGQGWHWSKALPAAEFTDWLRTRGSDQRLLHAVPAVRTHTA